MKPSAFDYHSPATLEDAVSLMAQLGYDAQLLAGGQSLIPLMNMRLARPEHIVDLAKVDALRRWNITDQEVQVGAMVPHRELERSAEIRAANPLLAAAAGLIAHFQIRERGTCGGSIAHADPSAELPLVATLLDARVHVVGAGGQRSIAAQDFFVSVYTTALEEGEIVTRVDFPRLGPGVGWACDEVVRRHGDFAMVSAAAVVSLEAGRYSRAELALGGVGATPVRVHIAEQLVGAEPNESLWADVAAAAARSISPASDIHATAEDRRDLARALVKGCLSVATGRATAVDVP